MMLEVDVEESPEAMVFTGRNRSSEETPAIEMELVEVDSDMIFAKNCRRQISRWEVFIVLCRKMVSLRSITEPHVLNF